VSRGVLLQYRKHTFVFAASQRYIEHSAYGCFLQSSHPTVRLGIFGTNELDILPTAQLGLPTFRNVTIWYAVTEKSDDV
jgi:hypothetical protein